MPRDDWLIKVGEDPFAGGLNDFRLYNGILNWLHANGINVLDKIQKDQVIDGVL